MTTLLEGMNLGHENAAASAMRPRKCVHANSAMRFSKCQFTRVERGQVDPHPAVRTPMGQRSCEILLLGR